MSDNLYYISLYDLLKTRPVEQHARIQDRYMQLMSHLSVVEDIEHSLFVKNVETVANMGVILLCMVKTDDETDIQIAGSATAIIEPKIIRAGKSVCHIEDVVVHPIWRGRHIASTLLQLLSNYAEHRNCYKVLLDCKEDLIPFYKKQGFAPNVHHLAKYIG